MSTLSRFMKENKTPRENAKYAPTKSLTDENGEPLAIEFRHITSKQNDELRDAHTLEVPVKGKPNVFRPKLNASRYIAELIAASTVYPDLYNKELQDSYGVKTPSDLIYAMVDDPGEYQDLGVWIQKFQGFDETLEDKVNEAKNE